MTRFIPQLLAVLSIICLSFFLGPESYRGFIVRNLGYDGAIVIGLSLLTYFAGITFLVLLFFPKTRKSLLLENKAKLIWVISIIVIVGYVSWGSAMWYGLSQSTDL